MTIASPVGFLGAFYTDFPTRCAYSEGAGPLRIIPQAVAVPEGVADLSALMREARTGGYSLIPRGAGSGMPGGNVGPGVVVDLQRFTSPLFVSAGRVAAAGAAITYAELTTAATNLQLRLPPDPSSGAFCTMGGMVATNAAGPRSARFGSIRPWVRGVELVTSDGERGWIGRRGTHRTARRPRESQQPELSENLAAVRRFRERAEPAIRGQHDLIRQRFPQTTKNSSGYALDQFLDSGDVLDLVIGSEGTLGIVTRLELSLDTAPSSVSTVLLTLRETDALPDAVNALRALDPSTLEFLDRSFLKLAGSDYIGDDGVDAVLIVEFEHDDPKVTRSLAADAVRVTQSWCAESKKGFTDAERDTIWSIRRGASPLLASLPALRSLQFIEDGCVPVENLGSYLRGVRTAAAKSGIDLVAFGHAGDGHVHVNSLVDPDAPDFERRLGELLTETTELTARLGGTPSGEHGDGRLRAPVLTDVYGSEVVDLFRLVKDAFDPDGVLNPDVILTERALLADTLKVGRRSPSMPDQVAGRLRQMERDADWATPKSRLVDP